MGPGLFESVYEAVIEYEVVNTYKLKVESQKSIPVVFLWFNIKSYFSPLASTSGRLGGRRIQRIGKKMAAHPE